MPSAAVALGMLGKLVLGVPEEGYCDELVYKTQ